MNDSLSVQLKRWLESMRPNTEVEKEQGDVSIAGDEGRSFSDRVLSKLADEAKRRAAS